LGDVLGDLSVAQPVFGIAEEHRPELVDQQRHRGSIAVRQAKDGVLNRFSTLRVHRDRLNH